MGTFRLFNHYIRTPFLLLAAIESMAMFFSVYLGSLISSRLDYFASIEYEIGFWSIHGKSLVYTMVMITSFAAMGLYEAREQGYIYVLSRVVVGLVVGVIIMTGVFYTIPNSYIGRGEFLISLGLSFLLILVTRAIFYRVIDQDVLKKRVLVYGAGNRAAKLYALAKGARFKGFRIVGFVGTPDEHNVVDREKVVELRGPLLDFVLDNKVEEIVVAVNDRRKSFPLDELLDCKLSGVDVTEPAEFLEREEKRVRIDSVHPSWIILSRGFKQTISKKYIARIFDIIFSVVVLLPASPLLILAIMGILLESGGRGPVFYRQERIGLGGKPFCLLKLRSMKENAEREGAAVWAAEQDARVTRVGKYIRKYRIDELPQIINILKGDMSLVGPRPERPEFVRDLEEKIPYYGERHRVKPGLTGWAQINYPYGSGEQDAIEKLQYDLYYVKNRNLLLDLYILLQTTEVILWGKGAR